MGLLAQGGLGLRLIFKYMNYELAKKLKDTGFPQEGDSSRQILIKPIDLDNPLYLYFPTLEELIEACEDSFGALLRISDTSFQSMGGKLERSELSPTQGRYAIQVLGVTPLESVANLWLVLHGK